MFLLLLQLYAYVVFILTNMLLVYVRLSAVSAAYMLFLLFVNVRSQCRLNVLCVLVNVRLHAFTVEEHLLFITSERPFACGQFTRTVYQKLYGSCERP